MRTVCLIVCAAAVLAIDLHAQDRPRILIDASRGGLAWSSQALARSLKRIGPVEEIELGQKRQQSLSRYSLVIRAGGSAIIDARHDLAMPYSASELSEYREYVGDGGKLLLLSGFVRVDDPDLLARAFGIEAGGISRGARVIDRFAPHSVTQNLKPIGHYDGAGLLSVPTDFTILAFASARTFLDLDFNEVRDVDEPYGAGVWGTMAFGRGTVVFMGDIRTLEEVPQPLTDNLLSFLLPDAISRN